MSNYALSITNYALFLGGFGGFESAGHAGFFLVLSFSAAHFQTFTTITSSHFFPPWLNVNEI